MNEALDTSFLAQETLSKLLKIANIRHYVPFVEVNGQLDRQNERPIDCFVEIASVSIDLASSLGSKFAEPL